MEIQQIVNERGKTHGKFSEGAEVFAALMETVNRNRLNITNQQYYGLTLAMAKTTRILVGNSDEPDHWLDAAAYFQLGGGLVE